MMELGVACLVLGGLWLSSQFLSAFKFPSTPTPIPSQLKAFDARSRLFECYLILHDHIVAHGKADQVASLESILPAITIALAKGPE